MTALSFLAIAACGAPGRDAATGSASPASAREVPTPSRRLLGPSLDEPLGSPEFDPLLGCHSLADAPDLLTILGEGTAGPRVDDQHPIRLQTGSRATFLVRGAPRDRNLVLTARFGAEAPGGVTLVTHATMGGEAIGLRLGPAGPELVRHTTGGDAVVAASNVAAPPTPRSSEWMLRAAIGSDGQRVTVAGKAWPAALAEPAEWQVEWSADEAVGANAEGTIGVAVESAAGSVALSYVLAALGSADGIDAARLSAFVSCSYPFPHAPPPRDGAADPTGDAANRREAAALLRWAVRTEVPRLVAVSAGTSNDLDSDDAIGACDDRAAWTTAARARAQGRPAHCITHLYEALEIAYAALRTAGYTDADLGDATRVQMALWGFGDGARGETLFYHPAGAADDVAVPVHDLGGASAAIHGPDGAPAIGSVPIASTFAYTDEHAQDDARAFRDALLALVAGGNFRGPDGVLSPLASDHTLVVSHSWGAAYATNMLLREYPAHMPGLHVDLGITAAMPKIVANLDELGPCAAHLLTGDLGACLGGSRTVAPALDVGPGFHVGPGAVPLYRIDRPDDPIAAALDVASLFDAARNLVDVGLSGHDYVIRAARSPADAWCTRSFQRCLLGNLFCSTGTETVHYPSSDASSYVGVYGIDTFHISCTQNGHVLEYWCDHIAPVGGTACKTPPLGGMRACASKPDDCP